MARRAARDCASASRLSACRGQRDFRQRRGGLNRAGPRQRLRFLRMRRPQSGKRRSGEDRETDGQRESELPPRHRLNHSVAKSGVQVVLLIEAGLDHFATRLKSWLTQGYVLTETPGAPPVPLGMSARDFRTKPSSR